MFQKLYFSSLASHLHRRRITGPSGALLCAVSTTF